MGIISRLKLDHPALGTAGGSALHAAIESLLTKVGDMTNSRYVISDNLNNAAYVDVDHNFQCAFTELKIILYSHNEGTGELLRIVAGGSPDLANFGIIATPSFETKKIRITNNTGSQQDIAVIVVQGDFAETLWELDDVDTADAPTNNQVLQYVAASSKWKPKTLTVDTWSVEQKTSSFTAVGFGKYQVDSAGGVIVATIPVGATAGTPILFFDSKGNFATNKLTLDITTNSQKINGSTTDVDCDVPGRYWLEYMNATYGWALYRN